MTLVETAYTLVLKALQPVLGAAARGEGKLARGVRGRVGVLQRIDTWSAARDPDRPLVWFHASSVGEGLQARAVIETFREARPDAQLVYTFFSPSAESLAARMPVDFADYLPIDVPAVIGRALDLLRPDVIAFSKSDVWPNMTREAAMRGVRLALLNATVPSTSSRLRGPARLLLRPSYGRLDRAAAISPADADRLRALGVSPRAISVMGDAHIDRVLGHAETVELDSDLLKPLAGDSDELVLVAGSTWGADEERLIPALVAVRERVELEAGSPERALPRGIRLVLVPHEPVSQHLREAEERLARAGLRSLRLSHLRTRWSGADVLLVDRVGVLGQLYAIADVAYVGGGWGTAGLHSVLEPAAFGLPILFGPHHANAREAADLVEAGGGIVVSTQQELVDRMERLIADPSLRAAAGAASRAYVEAGRGAVARGTAIIEELLGDRR